MYAMIYTCIHTIICIHDSDLFIEYRTWAYPQTHHIWKMNPKYEMRHINETHKRVLYIPVWKETYVFRITPDYNTHTTFGKGPTITKRDKYMIQESHIYLYEKRRMYSRSHLSIPAHTPHLRSDRQTRKETYIRDL